MLPISAPKPPRQFSRNSKMSWKRRARRCPSALPRSARRSATKSRRAITPSAPANSSRWNWNFSSNPTRWSRPFAERWRGWRKRSEFRLQAVPNRLKPELQTRKQIGVGRLGTNIGLKSVSDFTKASACHEIRWSSIGKSRRSWRITPAPPWTFSTNSRSANATRRAS